MVESQPPNNPRSGISPLRGAFVGRQGELRELKSALEDTTSGYGRLVMLAGEPGIGKTRTAQELGAHAETLGFLVLWGRCYEEAGAPPYWPWTQPIRSYVQQCDLEQLASEMGAGASSIAEMVSEIRDRLPDLPPPPQLDSPEQARFRLFDSITTFFKNASKSQPIMLVLDDLHWADQPSLLLLQFLAREMGESRLLVVGTYRDVELSRQHPLSETLAQLSREPVFRRELLRGLSREDTGDFVEVAAGLRPPQGLVESIYLQTEGNPFFMGEVIRLLAEQGELKEGDIGVHLSVRIPEGVREVIGQRLNRLSVDCNEMLRTASVIGREFDFRLLRVLSDELSENQLLEAIDEGLEAHLIEELTGGLERYQFSHALIRDTLSEELSTSRKVRMHARIAEALEEIYGANVESHAAELAHHFAEAATAGASEKLVRYSLLAGKRALATYAWEEALGYFERALAAKEGLPMDGETADLLSGLSRALLVILDTHRVHEALDKLNQAFDYYVEAGDISQAVAVAEYPLPPLVGQRMGLEQLLSRALALVTPDSHQAGRLLVRHGRNLGLQEGNYEEAQRAFGRALTIAQRESDLFLEMQALVAAANVDLYQLRIPESLEKSRRAIELAQRVDAPLTEMEARYWAGMAARFMADLEEVRQHAAAMMALAERLQDRWWLGRALYVSERICFMEGNWQAERDFNDRGLALLSTDLRFLANRAILECQVGDFDRAEAYLERVLEVMRPTAPGPTFEYAYPAIVLPLFASITGRVDQLEVAKEVAETVLSFQSASPAYAAIARAGLALLAMLSNDVAAAENYYAALEPTRGMILLGSFMAADRVLGLLAHTIGNLDQATAHFEDALAICRKGFRPELSWACHDYAGTLLLRNEPGDREKAMSLLDESLAISSELGMQPLMERVAALQERVKSQPAKAPIYPDGLTQREVEVLRLVALGKSNRGIVDELIIAEGTVRTHINNIYEKIGVANRAEATRYALTQGLL